MIVCSIEFYPSSRLLPNTYKQTRHVSRVSFMSRIGQNLHSNIFISWRNPNQGYSVMKGIGNVHFSNKTYLWYSICFRLGHKAGSMYLNCRSLASPLVGVGYSFFEHWVNISPPLFRWHTRLWIGYEQFLFYSLCYTWGLGGLLLEKITLHWSVKRMFYE